MASIELQNVEVRFPIYSASGRSFKSTFLKKAVGGGINKNGSHHHVEITALRDINLSLRHGNRVGLIGPNGAGKSTLLRTIAGVYTPTAGSIKVDGKIASLIDISLGMDPEATGFQNIRMRGVMMGLSLREVKAIEEEIAEFTELGDFLNMPVRTYSSGMHMRLGFAVSTAVPADIILMDEWLSVGDRAFLKKAENRLLNYINKSSILVIATHSKDLLKKINAVPFNMGIVKT